MKSMGVKKEAKWSMGVPRQWVGIRTYLVAMVSGAVGGVFLLFPINEFVYYHEHHPDIPTVWQFIYNQMRFSLLGYTPKKTIFYAVVGGLMGLAGALIFSVLQKRHLQIRRLHTALEESLESLITHGEGPKLEFKSSFRWDLKQEKVNKTLGGGVLKTLAGFMNAQGGTLIIGVDDQGKVTGIEKDYKTLKKKNRDGFELAIMTAVSLHMGPELCQNLHVMFHRFNGKDVCRILVSPARKPVYLKLGGDPRFYLRTGGSTRELNIQEAMSYISGRDFS